MAAVQRDDHPFEGMNPDQIAAKVERDIRFQARGWKRKIPRARRTARRLETAATHTAALYLSAHQDLYQHENSQAMKDRHHGWMLLLKQWFLDEANMIETRKSQEEMPS